MDTTPEPLAEHRLNEIEARTTHEHLTPGPWRLDREQCDCSDGYCHHGEYVTGVVTTVPTEIAAERCKRTGEQPRDYDFHRSEIGDFTDADWELMVYAREDVPALLADIRRLRDQLAAVTALHEKGEHNGLAICLHCASQMFPPPETGIWSESAYPCATLRELGITDPAV